MPWFLPARAALLCGRGTVVTCERAFPFAPLGTQVPESPPARAALLGGRGTVVSVGVLGAVDLLGVQPFGEPFRRIPLAKLRVLRHQNIEIAQRPLDAGKVYRPHAHAVTLGDVGGTAENPRDRSASATRAAVVERVGSPRR